MSMEAKEKFLCNIELMESFNQQVQLGHAGLYGRPRVLSRRDGDRRRVSGREDGTDSIPPRLPRPPSSAMVTCVLICED